MEAIVAAVSIAYALMCVGWCTYIGRTKHRPPWEGLLLGLTLGPVGVIVAACLESRPAPEVVESESRGLSVDVGEGRIDVGDGRVPMERDAWAEASDDDAGQGATSLLDDAAWHSARRRRGRPD